MSDNESNESRETVADIVADIRERAENAMRNGERLVHNEAVANMLTFVADRIEAAAKREREVVEADALFVGGVVEAARHEPVGNVAAMRDIVTALANVILPPRGKADKDGWLAWIRAMQTKARAALADATTENSSAVGNAAAMREALENAYSLLCEGISTEVDDELEHPFHLELAREGIQNALSAPARNCDLYATYQEAAEAHEEYYTAYIMRASNKFDSPMEFDKWLFAPAAERKGEDNGSK